MLEIYLENKYAFSIERPVCKEDLKNEIGNKLNIFDFYLLSNGKLCRDSIPSGRVHVVPQLVGGKGGFGSMLRAIGAQIEKTTNREACRDLSGRRLRDINEEKRLKTWIDQQAEREKEAADKKQRKLERLCQKPRHEFKDETYDKERAELADRVEDAVSQGLASRPSTSAKRKRPSTETRTSNSDEESEHEQPIIVKSSSQPSIKRKKQNTRPRMWEPSSGSEDDTDSETDTAVQLT